MTPFVQGSKYLTTNWSYTWRILALWQMACLQFSLSSIAIIWFAAGPRYESAFVIYCDRKKFPIMGRNMVELISWRLVGNAFPALVRSSLACNCNALHWCALSPAKTFHLCSTLGTFWRCIAGQSWHIQKMLDKLNLFESTHCSLCILNQNTHNFLP